MSLEPIEHDNILTEYQPTIRHNWFVNLLVKIKFRLFKKKSDIVILRTIIEGEQYRNQRSSIFDYIIPLCLNAFVRAVGNLEPHHQMRMTEKNCVDHDGIELRFILKV